MLTQGNELTNIPSSKRSYNEGYAAACQDLLSVIQQGVSDSSVASGSEPGSGMNIGKVMDWIEARLDAVKSRAEEESEDEDRDRERARKNLATGGPVLKKAEKKVDTAVASTSRRKERVRVHIWLILNKTDDAESSYRSPHRLSRLAPHWRHSDFHHPLLRIPHGQHVP